MQSLNIKSRLIVLSFLQFAIWGAYLTSMGRYLGGYGLGTHIGWFYSVQGIVSIFMPAIIGVIADRWVPAQRMLAFCHAVAATFMAITGFIGMSKGAGVGFNNLFWTYTMSVAFYMPTLALSNSVAYTALDKAGLDTVKAFPPIRVFGTIGFICSMWAVDLLGYQPTAAQYAVSGGLGLILAIYSFTLPECPISKNQGNKMAVDPKAVHTECQRSIFIERGFRSFDFAQDDRRAALLCGIEQASIHSTVRTFKFLFIELLYYNAIVGADSISARKPYQTAASPIGRI